MSLLAMNQSIVPQGRPEQFFSALFGRHMKPFPKRSVSRGSSGKYDTNRQWVFVGSKERMKSLATQATLYGVLADQSIDTSFFTPNGYYRRDLRLTETLRWLNAYIFDMDQIGESVQDIFERIDRAGLPRPTAVVQTPSGGYHVAYFFLDPVRATSRALRLYTAIMGYMAVDLGADLAAVGANRIFRTPTEENLVFFDPSARYDFEIFKNWREINHPFDPAAAGYVNLHIGDLMNHPALQHLLEAPCHEGQREQTALTLALAMKASGWSQYRAESALQQWFISCCAKGSKAGKDPFTLRDAVYKAGYVFRKDSLHAPKAEIIRELTGLPFFYQTRNGWESAKPRSERERVHLYEWESDLLALLKREKVLTGTQQELATQLNCPITSFKTILGQLKASGKVIVETKKGRGGNTVLRLPEPPKKSKVIEFPVIEVGPVLQRQETILVYADFRSRRIQSIEQRAVADELILPDPEGPD